MSVLKKVPLNGAECTEVMIGRLACRCSHSATRRAAGGDLRDTKPAAWAWEEDSAERFPSEGMGRGVVASTCFFCPARNARALVYGDNFALAGSRDHKDHLKWCGEKMRAMLGRDDGAIVIQGRQVRWCEFHAEVEADERSFKAIRCETGIAEGSNGLSAAVREDEVEGEQRVELGRREASHYIWLDRPDAQYVVKEACRGTARPTDMERGQIQEVRDVPPASSRR